MKPLLCTLLLSSLMAPACAQHQHPATSEVATPPVALKPGLGHLHHAVSTQNKLAQQFFDQGLTFCYAFHHEEAILSFQRAAELDPHLAMARWGEALALGPNINLDIDPDREKQAYAAIQKAVSLASGASEAERAYIEALAKRYSNDSQADLKRLSVEYSVAMKKLTDRYPNDLDAATLYAESLMDLRPWQLWGKDGAPAEGTEEIVSVLESVLKREPNHIGANHYYIHAVEASAHPERALASAKRLPKLAPGAGHLVHMPAHIYIRTGDYRSAARSNQKAVAVDEAFFKRRKLEGIYPMYYLHNLDFLRAAAMMEGRYAEAKQAADELVEKGLPMAKQMPPIEGAMAASLLVDARFRKWDALLQAPEPDASLPFTHALWRYARGLAYAARGSLQKAAAERDAFVAERGKFPPDAVFGFNGAAPLMEIVDKVLAAALAEARGDRKAAVAALREAASGQDALNYDEPPDFYFPVRETLGGAYLRDKRYADAEAVFRADLKQNPHNGRSLFGLAESLKAQGKTDEAKRIQREFDRAWKDADTPLRVEDL